MALVSVIMPAFNCSEYIQAALSSILNQTYENIEIIVVDDNSSDGTLEILKGLDDKRLRVFKNEKNLRIAKTLNKAIDLANGKYLARMDCDDISLPTRIEKQVQYLEQHYEVDIVGSWVSIVDKPKELWFTIVNGEFIKASTLFHCPICHPSVMYRAAFIKNNKYDEKCSKAQDYELWERAASLNYNFHNIPEVLLNYRLHENQISKTQNQEQILIANEVRKRALKRLFSCNELTEKNTELHIDLCNDKQVSLDAVHLFYSKCIDKNNELNYYDRDALKKVVSDWVFRQYYNNHKNFNGFINYYRNKNFFTKLDKFLLFKYFVKSVIGGLRDR